VTAYVFGLLLEATHSRKVLILGLIINFGLLAYFKYFNFLLTQIQTIFQDKLSLKVPDILLPLGISFFTFQAGSYIIDVYRRKTLAQKSLYVFATYKLAFPQLIAGPIVRYEEVKDTLTGRKYIKGQISDGLMMFTKGLAYKVLLANSIAATTDRVFSANPGNLTVAAAWLGAIGYTFQLYFDFAGYSLMAIGMGKVMGFTYPINFNLPYSATSITEFWQRWHMTLSRWFRDYLYIPLGGNQKGPRRTYFNLLVVFILCGLWHGAAFTFVIWGLYHGCFLVFERLGMLRLTIFKFAGVRYLYTWGALICGWVIFRSEDPTHALGFLKSLFGLNSTEASIDFAGDFNFYTLFFYLIAFLISTGFGLQFVKLFAPINLYLKAAHNETLRSLGIASLYILSLISLISSNSNPFIYFRF